jgi:molybdopterin synthase catalytic subunit
LRGFVQADGLDGSEEGPRTIASVTEEPLTALDLVSLLGTDSDGAVVAFEGRVRDHNRGRRVVRLHYEAYPEMADEVLRDIAREAQAQYPVTQVGIRHRVGTLDVADVSLVVAVAAAHRDPAFDAARYVIEQLKARLPVWKKEEYADGSSEWVESQPVEGE